MNINCRLAVKSVFALCCLTLASLGWASNNILRTPVPSWVVPVALPEVNGFPQDKIQNGVYYLLINTQVMINQEQETQYYHHHADYIVNQSGVEKSSQINIDYDPSYQHLRLHFLRVIRDGEAIDKTGSARMKLIQREEEMDKLVYSGRITLNIILDDIRKGDTIEYSFSRQGMNPVYQNIFAYSHYVGWSVPIGRLSLRLLWNKPKPLQHRVVNSNLELTRTETANGSEYLIQGDRIEPVKIDSSAPSWFSPWGAAYFSELKSWEEVARWSNSLYQNVVVTDDNIKQLAADIQSHHTAIDAQISAALRFVQDEIRYLGIELGQNSHRPTPAFETLRNRYGDCKDKTVLLLTLLKELDVKAYPALVNTEVKLDETLPNIRAFDHVITYIKHKGKHYWLDPTRSYQYGNIDSIHQPDYGHALVLKTDTHKLTSMVPEQAKHGVFVKDQFVISAEAEVEFSSESKNYGWNAEKQRQRLANKGRTQIQREYLEFFQRYYPGTAVRSLIEYADNTQDNILITTEHYQINNFWEDNSEKGRYEVDFYASIINSSLVIPNENNRVHPLELPHPQYIEQVIELQFEADNWDFDDESFVEDNKFFRFDSDINFNKTKRRLTLTYSYQSKADHVPPESFHDYLTALKKIDDLQNYGIYRDYLTATEDEPWFLTYLNATIILSVYGALYLLVILLWRINRWRNPEEKDAVFFPVSMAKLTIMWILTFGTYGMYWFYKNFRYIKEHENNATMPMARGFFYSLWYYSLWSKLKEDGSQRFESSHLPGKSLAILLALTFFCLCVAGSADALVIPSLLLSALLVFPLANYILFVNGSESPALMRNSKWRFHHYLLALLSIPLCIMLAGSEIGIFPNETVVKGSRILGWDIKLMQRRGIINPGDNIEYFYSDAFLFVSDDGNGFTQRHVFSYWKDENDSLLKEYAEYDKIQDIQIDWKSEFGENSTVTIIREDGSQFLLFVSNMDHKDRLFVSTLKERWLSQR
jgi:transglutaminase-like putative cysteine protease